MRLAVVVALGCLLSAATARAIDERKIVDLTYGFGEKTLHWPTAKPFRLERVAEGRTPQGFWYASYDYSGSEHAGTHLDAPFHFAEGRWTTGQIPLGRLIGPGAVLDVRAKTEKDPDYLVTAADVRSWEKRHGRLPEGAILLIRTGWGRYWGDRERYFGSKEPGDAAGLHFPGLGREAAELLVRERRIKAVGIDTPSIDHGPSRDFAVHRVLGQANVPIFENVASLERLPARGATIFAIPMKIEGGSGAPLRIFAVLP
ncbi:MAG TPA: cyclase family protein [candidate division Zixibacteria bacterium]|nr:cyclase family protein [candidate division Zixibacteria bacterium]